jgi:hypothetical protein
MTRRSEDTFAATAIGQHQHCSQEPDHRAQSGDLVSGLVHRDGMDGEDQADRRHCGVHLRQPARPNDDHRKQNCQRRDSDRLVHR